MTPAPTTLPINLQNPAACGDTWTYSVGFKSKHANGANFSFGDGAVRYVMDAIDMNVYQRMGHHRDGKLFDSME
jgi:prepilin-type processing-associated H-X9-DG protein